jgi:glycerol-3-phosphate acyltransferase PlsY
LSGGGGGGGCLVVAVVVVVVVMAAVAVVVVLVFRLLNRRSYVRDCGVNISNYSCNLFCSQLQAYAIILKIWSMGLLYWPNNEYYLEISEPHSNPSSL